MKRRPNWWVLGWHRKRALGRRFTLHGSLCLSNFNRPLLSWGPVWGSRFISIGWGNGQSDPAWSIELDLNEPR